MTDQAARANTRHLLQNGLRRRDILYALGAAGLLDLAGCCPLGPAKPPVPTDDSSKTIDVHCHVFNSRDIPIDGFIRQIVLNDQPTLAKFGEPLVKLLTLVMDAQAKSAVDEAADIRKGNRATLAAVQAQFRPVRAALPPGAEPPALPGFDEDLVRQRVIDAVKRLRQANGGAQPRPSGAAPKAEEAPAPTAGDETFLHLLAARNSRRILGALPPGPLAEPPPPSPEEVAEGVVSTRDEILGVFYMATLMTRPRAELADRLETLPAQDGGEISLFLPAMVDYSYWLNDQNVTPLEEQIDVMSAVAAIKVPYAVHPWVSYCPWRQIIEPEQFDLVTKAVEQGGFIGIKLYPVMGFRPYGNTDAPKDQYPPRLTAMEGWGKNLDAAMAKLFDWCVANDVPIMAHCSFSQDPTDAAGQRGSPQAWQTVFQQERWQKLRVNLAHLGGFWDLVARDGVTANTWTRDLVPMLQTIPTLYADLADYDSILERPDSEVAGEMDLDRRTLAELDKLLVQFPGAKAKLMYGTDWVMLSRSLGVEQYYPDMKGRIPTYLHLSKTETAGFLGFNAARFLGLAKDENGRMPATRRRLQAFRQTNGLGSEILGRWDP